LSLQCAGGVKEVFPSPSKNNYGGHHQSEHRECKATLLPIEGVRPEEFGPRRIKPDHLEREAKKPRVYTKAIRSTRNPDRLKRAS
jgi:hypothetical protein